MDSGVTDTGPSVTRTESSSLCLVQKFAVESSFVHTTIVMAGKSSRCSGTLGNTVSRNNRNMATLAFSDTGRCHEVLGFVWGNR
ncbi:hypothetical protein L596_007280 [Steinernema carpocapsae]|uniref:Uncharacterized protein n=1 Tax=Steinernema carpocapsae TaxID=34508 RepID=A0A4U5P970_STECR|nr:hypothetical protein L596_007280 [Steinernema carpocapsae]